MKKTLMLILLVVCAQAAKSQNLVPNPNFAVHDTCPHLTGELSKCKYWQNPTQGSPDYFNVCNDTIPYFMSQVGVPTNSFGYQASASNSYMGMFTLIDASLDYREYVQTDISPLVPGTLYRVLLRVSLGDSSSYATHAPGVFFYNNADFSAAGYHVITRTPQVAFSSSGNITDKVNWVTVTDTFTADSAYTHLVAGNFNNDATTSKATLSGTTHYAYYYIDSMSVEKVVLASHTYVANYVSEIKAALFPNPLAGDAVLSLENLPGNNNRLSIRNIQGAVVRRIENIGSGQITIARDGLEPGFYYYQLQGEKGVLFNGKMIVR